MALGTGNTGHVIEFETERLRVGPWHRQADRLGVDLVDVVCDLLTADTTAELPEPWRGAYDVERAERWVVERDGESPTLLASADDHIIGLLVLFEADRDLRLGYVIGPERSGNGYATELVGGLVEWARSNAGIATVTGGVSTSNPASARVLERNGFQLLDQGAEMTYRLDVSGVESG